MLSGAAPNANCMVFDQTWVQTYYLSHLGTSKLIIAPQSPIRLKYVKYEEFENTKGIIKICISKKNRQHNGQKKKYKRTNNDLQNIHIKLKIE